MDTIAPAIAALAAANIELLTDEPMSRHTTFKIGGPADIVCFPHSPEQFLHALAIAEAHRLPRFFLGRGSNVLFGDAGYRGLVICLERMNHITVAGTRIHAGAGAELLAVCHAARDAALAGLEFACGIPGSVGGAVYMNAGAFDGEVNLVLEHVRYVNEMREIITAPACQLALSYRASIFQHRPWCVLEATFRLERGDRDAIAARMDAIMQKRSDKQPLDKPSAGSAFKRPAGAFASALIDETGLRGYRVGGAAISEKHCGFIVNLGGATCADVLALADQVAEKVYGHTGYRLEKEFRVVGE
ncbi:MAG: UDP-N-acetylmuramate dehydrogenase [Ruminococcaceae bacterium]|nr:UDP-N-acetylmuramate dehydrogenase [Oscillospiraceae bacterium]